MQKLPSVFEEEPAEKPGPRGESDHTSDGSEENREPAEQNGNSATGSSDTDTGQESSKGWMKAGEGGAPSSSYSSSLASVSSSLGLGSENWRAKSLKGEGESRNSHNKRLYNAKTDVIMKIETLPDSHVKATAGLLNFAIIIGSSAVLVLFTLKIRNMEELLLGRPLIAWNCGVALFDLLIVGSSLCFLSYRVYQSNKENKQWSLRRKKNLTLHFIELVAQFINSVFFLAPNLYLLRQPCGWYDVFVHFSGFIRMTCWNVLFLISTVSASNANPYVDKNSTQIPFPFSLNPVVNLLLRCLYEGMLLWITLVSSNAFGDYDMGSYEHNPACVGEHWQCQLVPTVKYLTIGIGLVVLYYFLYFCYKIKKAVEYLRSKPYFQFRIANIIQGLQVRIRTVAYTFIIISLGLLWYFNMHSCLSYALAWFGFLPMQFVMSVLLTIWACFFHPIKSSKDFTLSIWLQEFSWSERELDKRKAERCASMCSADYPMFCFETSMKLYYWSELIYDYREVDTTDFELEVAMNLYGLNKYELFLEPQHDTKVLLAWSDKHVVLAFRGTRTVKNVLADLKWFRKPHPPKRGKFWRTPMVHGGFLDSWQSNDLNERILQAMKEIIGEWDPQSPKKVFVTGHSLGGALASLAAFDIARYVGVPKCCIQCYTFGSPRTGNHSFAADYNTYVPNTWHMINDQDYITQTLKFIAMYKRHGHRTIINSRGDLIVKPSFLEINVLKQWGNMNVGHHLLGSYRKSLIAIMKAQFKDGKKIDGGMNAVLELLHPKSAPHMSKVLGVDRASLLRLKVFGDRIESNLMKKKKEARRERLEKFAWSVKTGTTSMAKSVLSSVSSIASSRSSALERDGMCPNTTMACGRQLGHDLAKERRTSADLCMEGGFICPFSRVAHVTFDGSTPIPGSTPPHQACEKVLEHTVVIPEVTSPVEDRIAPS